MFVLPFRCTFLVVTPRSRNDEPHGFGRWLQERDPPVSEQCEPFAPSSSTPCGRPACRCRFLAIFCSANHILGLGFPFSLPVCPKWEVLGLPPALKKTSISKNTILLVMTHYQHRPTRYARIITCPPGSHQRTPSQSAWVLWSKGTRSVLSGCSPQNSAQRACDCAASQPGAPSLPVAHAALQRVQHRWRLAGPSLPPEFAPPL